MRLKRGTNPLDRGDDAGRGGDSAYGLQYPRLFVAPSSTAISRGGPTGWTEYSRQGT